MLLTIQLHCCCVSLLSSSDKVVSFCHCARSVRLVCVSRKLFYPVITCISHLSLKCRAVWMFHNYMLQKCTLLFKIVTVLLPGVLSEGSSVLAHNGQTPISMDNQGVVNVFVPLLSRAAFPFLLKKENQLILDENKWMNLISCIHKHIIYMFIYMN